VQYQHVQHRHMELEQLLSVLELSQYPNVPWYHVASQMLAIAILILAIAILILASHSLNSLQRQLQK